MEKKIKEFVPKLKALAKEKEVEELAFSGTNAYVFRGGAFSEDPSLEISGKYSHDKSGVKDAFTAAAQMLLDEASLNAEVELELKLKGMKFPTIANVTPVLNKALGIKDLAPAAGEVILYDFWATWCGPCQHPMGHNQEMLATHPEWKGKARIVGISIDDDIAAPEKRVTEKKWTDVEHYWVSGGWESEIAKKLSIHGIPFCVLVDKNGLVALAGHPSSMDLEINIPKLIKGETIGGEKDSPAGPDASSVKDKTFTFDKCKAEMNSVVMPLSEAISKVQPFLMAGVYSSDFMREGDSLKSAFVIVRFQWGPKSAAAAKLIKDKIHEAFDAKLEIKMQDKEVAEKSIAKGSKCSKCSKSIAGEDQYMCSSCTPAAYFCKACIESVKAAKATELVHPHPLFYIQKESTTELDCLKRFTLKVIKADAAGKEHSNVACDACGTRVNGIRWACANCETADICDACFNLARGPANPKLDGIMAKVAGAGHDMKKHVYIRLDFPDWTDLHY